MSGEKQLWVLAGANGVGKSTFYHQYLSKYGIKFVNAGLIARAMDSNNPERLSYEAATLATEMRENMITQGESFCFETVFSHKSCDKKVNPLPIWVMDILPSSYQKGKSS